MLMMFLSLLIHVIGSLETAANLICAREFENKTLIWPEKSTSITGYVESRAWYKGDKIVSWINEIGFRESPGYEGRLKHVGDGNIKVRNVTRIDSGNYKQISKFRGVSDTFDASVNLQVIDAPARTCKPVISHEGSKLKAFLPSDDVCTTLRPEWKDNKTAITQNGTSILDIGTDCGVREYMACAVGEATKCFQGNMSDFCTHYTVPQHKQCADGVTLPLAVTLSAIAILAILAICGIFWMRRKGIICQKCYDFSEFIDYLKKRYGTMTDVSMYPVGEIKMCVTEVFARLEVERIETRDTEDTNTTTECDLLVFKEDTVNLMTQSKSFPPIMIVGDSGSGKSTWCKQLVYCWSHNSQMFDTEMQGLNLPCLKNFQILLYLPLENSDEGRSFQELLQQSLFRRQLSYLKFVSNHVNGQNLSQSILIVIDGLDKISKNSRLKLISELLESKLSSCTFIFTSRPSSFNQISDARIVRAMKLYKVCEMNLETSREYVSRVVNIINQQKNTKLNPVHFLTFTKYRHVKCLLASPYHCLSLLSVWMESKTPDIQMKDILFIILGKLLNHYMCINSCNQRIHKSPSEIKKFVDSVSEIAVEIFRSEMNTEDPCHENVTQGSNMLQAASELGLITESLGTSKLTFTNTLIYQYLVANLIAMKKGPAFYYIVSGRDIALENSLIIHMICQFSPARGKEIFDKLSKQKGKNYERHNELNIKYSIKQACKWKSAKGKEVSLWWLQNLMYKRKLNDQILLFVTDALKFTDSLSVLELKNLGNNEYLVFWLPFSETLKVLKLNISKCTLLLCPEWKYEKPTSLKEVIIESMSIDESTRCALLKAVETSRHQTKLILPQATITNINEIMFPRLDYTTNS